MRILDRAGQRAIIVTFLNTGELGLSGVVLPADAAIAILLLVNAGIDHMSGIRQSVHNLL